MKIRALFLLILMTFSIIPLVGCGESEDKAQQTDTPLAIIKKAMDARSTVKSYRANFELISTPNGETQNDTIQIEFVAPDRYRQTSSHNDDISEDIRIGKLAYYHRVDDSNWTLFEEESDFEFPPQGPGFLIRGNYSNYEDRVNWGEISVETVDGTDCFHFSGEVDMNLAVDDMIANAQKNPGELGTEELRIWDLLRQSKETIELWIGTHDY
ncbi:MAG: hypothetical protein PHV74_13635, partial [Dehalococcoidia bacterium]|nr:hypothetical protein [Dehalococcoidia bacterium]